MDLFADHEKLPQHVQDILEKHGEDWDDSYDNCRAMLKDMEAVGYTFEYYLDAVPYDLRRMVKVGEQYRLDELEPFYLDEGCLDRDYTLSDEGNTATIQHKKEALKIVLSLIGMHEGKKVYVCVHSDIDVEILNEENN